MGAGEGKKKNEILGGRVEGPAEGSRAGGLAEGGPRQRSLGEVGSGGRNEKKQKSRLFFEKKGACGDPNRATSKKSENIKKNGKTEKNE